MLSERFRVQNKQGIFVVLDTHTKVERPATALEVELWSILVKSLDIHKEDEAVIKIGEADLLKLLSDNKRLRVQVTSLQETGTEQQLKLQAKSNLLTETQNELEELRKKYEEACRTTQV